MTLLLMQCSECLGTPLVRTPDYTSIEADILAASLLSRTQSMSV